MSNLIEALQVRWEALLQSFLVEPKVSQEIFQELIRAYSSAERHYHTLEHIDQVLEIIEQKQSLANNVSALRLAAWFHDVIYDPKARDNEEKSAAYAGYRLSQLKIPMTVIAQVTTMILDTQNHQPSPGNLDSQIFLDADLAILGAPKLDYESYAQAIRREYSWVSDDEYRTRRKQVLQNFLQRKRIYFTNQLFLSLEVQARLNLQAEIDTLSGR
jgi:predicted metal-dependent HD superfamily phosphohydrolase